MKMDDDAIKTLELMECEYTIHKLKNETGIFHYKCFIDPEYGMCMELMSSKVQTREESLPLAIYRASRDVSRENIGGQ